MKDLDEQAYGELRDLLLALDEPLAFDDKGRAAPGGREVRRRRGRAHPEGRDPDQRPALRARHVPAAAARARARVRGELARAARARDHERRGRREAARGLLGALLPALGAELGAVPDRRLQVALLGARADYGRYLDMSGSRATARPTASPTAWPARRSCAARAARPSTCSASPLHELTHLYQGMVCPAAFPSWYLEGSAEANGGEGTFRWDGEKLETGGVLAPARLAELRASPLALKDLLGGDALALLASDKAAARRFYAESWAFLRFLEQGAGEEIAQRLERWRTLCSSSAVGVDFDKPYVMDAAKSSEFFQELFGKDLVRLEQEFTAWLAAQ
jgi:hypothetical protein